MSLQHINIFSSFQALPSGLVLVLLSLFLSIAVSCMLMPWLLNICYRFRLFDSVNGRKVHKQNIPRMGGVIFVPSVAVTILLVLFVRGLLFPVAEYNIFHQSSMIICMGTVLLYFIGILDDIAEISANVKFLVQLVAALTFPISGLYFNSLYGFFGIYELPLWICYLLTVFISLLIINAFNLIDGIDGLAASLAVFALTVYVFLFYQLGMTVYCVCIVALIGTLLVYLPYNLWGTTKNQTKTFMGDSGSLILGIVIAYFTVKYAMDDVPVLPHRDNGLLVAYSAVIIPCFDLCRVALCRLKRGKGIFEPDKTHLHHKFLAKGLGMHPTFVIILLLQCFLFALNVLLFNWGISMVVILVVDVALFAGLNIWLPNDKESSTQFTDTNTEKIVRKIEGELPKISIITSTYNSAATIRDTFESILHQTYQNYEVIVVDGVSKDGTMDIIREYAERFEGRLVYKSEPDRGLYEAMNKGYAMATSPIVGLLNSDDFFTSENVLETVAQAFASNDIDAVYGDVHYVSADDLSHVTRYYSSRMFSRALFRFGFMPAHPSFYCRRELLLESGLFNLSYRVAADFDQVFRLLYLKNIRAKYLHLDFVTMREGGASNANLSSRMTIMSEHQEILRTNGLHSNMFLLSLRYIYKALEIVLSPIMSHSSLPNYIKTA